ncbi:hypothetical protein QNI19_22925 [Cytophagaceae bacterium DM2B3-1]|uniref:STAS/SEC14 domain-containing protein n=1 Tax=Xanthocytophaga flava TaxID=3048013 RepID=A0ABT7CQ12_9BACT|nr:hypothetical protein [Xanthocytophaga flavus]MDJ1495807.1 hypothetical protein [Xanthocytophaga flavus]
MKTSKATSYGNMKLKFDTDNIVVYYDKVNQWLFVSCANQLTFVEARKGFGECLEFIEQNHCSRLIIDSYAIKYSPLLPEINRWLVNEWLPTANEQGLRYIAQLTPPEQEWRLFNASTSLVIPPTVQIELFTSLVNAVKWLYLQE